MSAETVPAAEIEVVAEVIWNDFSFRLGGPWRDVPPETTAAIQVRATAKACVEAIRANRPPEPSLPDAEAGESEAVAALQRALCDTINALSEAVHGDGLRDTKHYDPIFDSAERALRGSTAHHAVARVIDNNQPGRTAIIEILTDPPTLDIGMRLYGAALSEAKP